jgi:O-antigen ligase
VRRFQGIFDGPNQAAYFLLGYLGVILHIWNSKKDWHWLLYTSVFVIFGLIFMTYCRSALLGVIGGGAVVIGLNIVTIIKKHMKSALVFLGIIVLFSGLVYLKYGEGVKAIVLRGGSSKGHYERMLNGIERFKEKPLGQGLAESGPAYRFVHDVKDVKEDEYIPESWYIQQLVEGGIIGTLLFLAIMGMISWNLYRRSIFIFG